MTIRPVGAQLFHTDEANNSISQICQRAYKLCISPTQCTLLFSTILRTNSGYFPTQNWLTCLYNVDGMCSLWSMNPVFMVSVCTWDRKCLFCGSGGHLPPPEEGVLDQSTWNLWWTKWYCGRFFCQYVGFLCEYHSTSSSWAGQVG
jgi:hypothetical protein